MKLQRVGSSAALQSLRQQVDEIDCELLQMLSRRYEAVRKIGQLKAVTESELPIRPEREAEIMERLNTQPSAVPREDLQLIWRTILSLSARAQRPFSLALWAPPSARPAVLEILAIHYGNVIPHEWVGSAQEALRAARIGSAIALLPLDSVPGADQLDEFQLLGQYAIESPECRSVVALGRTLGESQSELWSPGSWRSKILDQLPTYPDPDVLTAVVAKLETCEPIVRVDEVVELQERLESVQQGTALLIQAGSCSEPIDHGFEEVERLARLLEGLRQSLEVAAGMSCTAIGRLAGQFAKPRSQAVEGLEKLPVYRGDAVNDFRSTLEARRPDPRRLLEAHAQSKRVRDWLRELNFSNSYLSHEALLLPYEQALTRRDDQGRLWDLSAHTVWIGDRTRRLDGAHLEFIRGIANPIGIKCGPSLEPEELIKLLARVNPDRIPGRVMLITRLGIAHVQRRLPLLIQAVQTSGHEVIWLADPMHGNNRTHLGSKVRLLPEIIREIEDFVAIARSYGVHPAGLHLEITADEVEECVDALEQAVEERRYTSKCDPRLNTKQAKRCVAAFATALAMSS